MLQVSRRAINLYKILCCALLICINLMFQFDGNKQLVGFFMAFGAIFFGILSILFVQFAMNFKFCLRDLIVLATLIILQVICLIFRNTDGLIIVIASLFFFFLNTKDIVKIYFYALTIVLLIVALSSFIGVLPMMADGFPVFGFGYKNRIGFIIFSIALYIFFIIELREANKKEELIGFIILVIALFFERLVQDRTALILILFFIMLYFLHIFRINNVVMQILIVSLPVILIIFSLFLTFNFLKIQWIFKLNEWLSWRIGLWNNDWNMYGVTLFPQQINSYFSYTTSYGQFMTITALDGYFALGILKNGAIFFLISILALMNMLYFNFKNMDRQKELIICLTVTFILYSFSETLPVIGYLCFLFPTAMCFKKD